MFSFIAPAYHYFPILVPSLIRQTDPNWELILLHDTFNQNYVKIVEQFNDERIKLYFSRDRKQNYGHPLRQIGLTQISSQSEYVVHTNADNIYTDNFVSDMRSGVGTAQAVFCDCIHSHYEWKVLYTKLQYGQIDCGCVAVRTAIAKEIGWKSLDFEADWHYLQEILIKYGVDSFKKIDKVAFCHN